MNKTLLCIVAILYSITSFAQNGDVIGKRVIANQSFYLKDYTVNGIKRDTANATFGDSSKLTTAKAVKDFVGGRIASATKTLNFESSIGGNRAFYKENDTTIHFISWLAGFGIKIDTLIDIHGDTLYSPKLDISAIEKNTIDVFIVGGQSNAEGSGDSTTSIKIKDSSAYVYYKGLKMLKDPVGTSTWGSAWTSFAANYYRLTGHKVCIVPTASGGSTQTIAADWYGSPNNWDTTNGHCFKASIDSTNRALTALRAVGFNPVLKGILWAQGEGDGRGISLSIIDTNTYYNSLTRMIRRFKDTLQKQIPFYIIQSGYYRSIYEGGMAQIRLMQDKAQSQDSMIYVVFRNTKDFVYRTGYLNPDSVHYSQLALNEIGHQVAENIVNSFYRDSYLFSDKQVEVNKFKYWYRTRAKVGEDSTMISQVIVGDNNGIPKWKVPMANYDHMSNAPFIVSRDKDANNGNAPYLTLTTGNAPKRNGFLFSGFSNVNGVTVPRMETMSVNDSLGFYTVHFTKKAATGYSIFVADYDYMDTVGGNSLTPINATAKLFKISNGGNYGSHNPSNEIGEKLSIFGDGRGKITGNRWDYASNYHSNFSSHSIIDKDYSDSSISRGVINTNIVTSATSITLNCNTIKMYINNYTSGTVSIINPTGTPYEGQEIIYRIIDGGAGTTLSWGAGFRGGTTALPTSIAANKTTYTKFMYNGTDNKWDLVLLIAGF